MANVTTEDVQALIAFAINNNPSGVNQALNIPSNSSAEESYNRLWAVFVNQGINGVKNLLSRVPLDKATNTTALKALYVTFDGSSNSSNLQAKTSSPSTLGKCVFPWQHGFDPLACVSDIGDAVGGSTTVTTPVPPVPPTIKEKPLLSTGAIIGLSAFAFVIILILGWLWWRSRGK